MVLGAECEEVRRYMLTQLQEIMEDTDIYGWKCVRSYHVGWMQHIEQGRATWGEEGKKIKLRRFLVWHRAPNTSKSAPISVTTARQNTQAPWGKVKNGYFSQPSKSGD